MATRTDGEGERGQAMHGPDADPDLTYAAVGRATSAWEHVEVRLADLYSIFVRRPQRLEAFARYGREASRFDVRMRVLTSAAHRYFLDQRDEAAFDRLVSEVKDLHAVRNRIAHGVVAEVPIDGGTSDTKFTVTGAFGWFLVPPWYALHPLTKRTDVLYFYNSHAIQAHADTFSACAVKVRNYRNTLDANWREPPESFERSVWLGTPRPLPPGR